MWPRSDYRHRRAEVFVSPIPDVPDAGLPCHDDRPAVYASVRCADIAPDVPDGSAPDLEDGDASSAEGDEAAAATACWPRTRLRRVRRRPTVQRRPSPPGMTPLARHTWDHRALMCVSTGQGPRVPASIVAVCPLTGRFSARGQVRTTSLALVRDSGEFPGNG